MKTATHSGSFKSTQTITAFVIRHFNPALWHLELPFNVAHANDDQASRWCATAEEILTLPGR
jgi:hypothetical protein